MTPSDSPTLAAERWLAYWREKQLTGQHPAWDGEDLLGELIQQDPDAALTSILTALAALPPSPDDALFQALAAGPLEDLLARNGPGVIDWVEGLAAEHPPFKLLLGGVWRSTIDPDVWQRIEWSRGKVW